MREATIPCNATTTNTNKLQRSVEPTRRPFMVAAWRRHCTNAMTQPITTIVANSRAVMIKLASSADSSILTL